MGHRKKKIYKQKERDLKSRKKVTQTNFGELLEWVSLFENNSEITFYLGSNTRPNSGQ